MNKVTIKGGLAKAAEIMGKDHNPIIKLRVITTESWRDANNEIKESSAGHDVSVFGWRARQLADNLNLLTKGALVSVQGKLNYTKSKNFDKWYTQIEVSDSKEHYIDIMVRFKPKRQNNAPQYAGQPHAPQHSAPQYEGQYAGQPHAPQHSAPQYEGQYAGQPHAPQHSAPQYEGQYAGQPHAPQSYSSMNNGYQDQKSNDPRVSSMPNTGPAYLENQKMPVVSNSLAKTFV